MADEFDPSRLITVEEPAFDPKRLIAVPEERQAVFHEDRGQVLDYPSDYDPHQIDYSLATSVDKEDKSGFFGMVNYAKGLAFDYTKGLAQFFLSTPQIAGSLIKESGEVSRQKVAGGGKEQNYFLRQPGVVEETIKSGQKLIDMNKEFLKKVNIQPSESTGPKKVAFDLGGATGSITSSIGLVYLTKNPTAVAPIFGVLQKAQIYEEARAKGLDPQTASDSSTISGIAEAALEKIGLHVFLESVKVSKPIARIALRSATEGVQEGSQQGAEESLTKLYGIRNDSMSDIVKRIAYSSALGLVAGAPAAMVSTYAEELGVKKDLKALGLSDEEIDTAIKTISDKQMQDGLAAEVADMLSRETSPMVMPSEQRLKGYQEVQKEFDKLMPQPTTPEKSALGELSNKDFVPKESSTRPTFEDQARKILGETITRDKVNEGIQDVKIKAKLADLDEKAMVIDQSLRYLESRQRALQKSGKDPLSLANVTNMIKEGTNEFKLVDAERGHILTSVKEELDYNKEKLNVTGKQLTDLTLQHQIKGFKQGVSAGKDISEKMFKETKDQLREFIKSTELNPTEAGRIMSTRELENIKTPRQLANKINDLSEKIDGIVNQRKAKDLKEKITSLLDTTSVRMDNGKPVGKYTPEIQQVLDKARGIADMTRQEAWEKLQNNLEKIGEEIPSDEMRLENHLLETMAGMHKRNPEELAGILGDLEGLTATGRAESLLKKFSRAEKQAADRDSGLKVLTGGKPLDEVSRETFKQKVFKSFITAGKSLSSNWSDLLDQISSYDKTSKKDQSFLSKRFDTIKTEITERHAVRGHVLDLVERGKKAFDLKNEYELAKKLHADMAEDISHVFKFSDGKQRLLSLSRSQMRKRWMELQDPTLHEQIVHPESNAYTREIIEWIENNLTAKDKAFAQSQLDFYKEYYKSVNETYKSQYGVNLPFNEFYSPVRRLVEKEMGDLTINQDAMDYASFLPGSFKSRVKNYRPFADINDWEVFNRHVLQMEHFKHWADPVRDMNAFFSDGEVRRTIEKQFGKDVNGIIDSTIKDFKNRGQRKAQSWEKWVDVMRTGKVVSALGGKAAQIPKQMTGIFGYAEFVSPKEFAEGLGDFVANPKHAIDILGKSKLIQLMDGNITQEFVGFMSSEESKSYLSKPSVKNAIRIWMSSVNFGAKAGNILGGWPVYKATLAKTGSHEKAMDAFESALSKTQPTSLLSTMSQYQKGNSLQKLFTLFTSAQNKYFQREMGSIRNAIAGRATPAELAKVMAIHHILIPSLFQFIADGFKWEEEEQVRAMLTGPLNGVLILGDAVDMMVRAALIESAGFELDQYPSTNNLMEPVEGLIRAFHKLNIDDIDAESFLDSLKTLSTDAVGPMTGLPTKLIFDSIPKGISDISDNGEVGKGLLKFGGWAPAHIDKIYDK